MALNTDTQWRVLIRCRRGWFAPGLFACVLLASLGSLSHASLVCPQQAAVDVDELIPATGAGTAAGSRSAPVALPSQDGDDNNPLALHSPPGIPSGGTTSGSSSAPSSGASASTVSALGTVSAFVLHDADLVRWVAVEERLNLPTPPGNDLLRPPQVYD